MKFKKGDPVEVLRRGKEQCDSWFPGTIISAVGYVCTVLYQFLNQEGNSVVEDVTEENLRPSPPPVEAARWAAGDIIEFFDAHCWRVGKVAKVLNFNRFVIKPFGSIRLREFERSDLRIRQVWECNKWVMLEKVGGNKESKDSGNTSKYIQGLDCVAPELVIHKEGGTKENRKQEQFETFPPAKILKRKHENNFGSSSPIDAATGVKEKKAARAELNDTHPRGTQSVLGHVADGSCSSKNLGKKLMIRSKMDVEKKERNNYSLHPCTMPTRVVNESSECSVASCSGNDLPENPIRHSQKSWDIATSSFNDARTPYPLEPGRKQLPSYPKVQLEADIHRLELDAYQLTMTALYASGPLSWEQESLLTNLRLSLHISNEEHLLHLRHLLSSQVL